MTERSPSQRVLVTGATGFVGQAIVRRLLDEGYAVTAAVRTPDSLYRQHPGAARERLAAVRATITDRDAMIDAARSCQAAIHLVGIIMERRLKGQTFQGVHVDGTCRLVEAVREAGVKRLVHMSALGTGPGRETDYYRSKWLAEQKVRESGLDWTIFQPSLIHGRHGGFNRIARQLVCGLAPPFIPYFGNGKARVQPVSVADVAHCFVDALRRPETIGQAYPLGGPDVYTWIQLYNACRACMSCARHWKPLVPHPVPVAKVMAALSAPLLAIAELLVPSLGLFRFDAGQVDMTQKDSVCDHREIEQLFEIKLRRFEDELRSYET